MDRRLGMRQVLERVVSMVEGSLGRVERGPWRLGDGRLLPFHCVLFSICPFIDVSTEVMTERLLERGKTSGRSDDKDQAALHQEIEQRDQAARSSSAS